MLCATSKKMTLATRRIIPKLVIFVIVASSAIAQPKHLTEDRSVFPNPERGFYLYQPLDRLDVSVAGLRDERGITLVWGSVPAAPRAKSRRTSSRASNAASTRRRRPAPRSSCADGHVCPGGDYTTYEDPALEIIEGHMAHSPRSSRATPAASRFSRPASPAPGANGTAPRSRATRSCKRASSCTC